MMLVVFLIFLLMLFFGIPVAISIGLTSIAALFWLDIPLIVVGQKMITGMDSFLLIAIPFFILAGELMNIGKITDRIFSFARAAVGFIPGGLGHANILASLIFSGMSGSAIADTGGLGTIEIKAMRDAGYDDEFAGSVTAASSTIGPIFPPSIPMVIYASIAEVSVGRMFLGGIIPGLLMAVALMVMVFFYALRKGYPREPLNPIVMVQQFFRAFIPLMTPVIIISGFLTGWFTPTEASAVAVAYAIIIGMFVYRELSWKHVGEAILKTALSTANVLLIIAVSTLFSFILTTQGVAMHLSMWITGITTNPNLVLLILNVILLLLGMIMEPGAIMILVLPVILPLVRLLGIDLVHFGVVMVLNLMIGMMTPPFGMCLFTVSQVGSIPLSRLSRAIIPFIFPLVTVLMVITYFPGIVLWLPGILKL